MILDFVRAKIKLARKLLSLNQADLAKKIGVARATIAGYESGKNRPSIDEIHKISKVTNIPIGWFFEPVTADDNIKRFLLAYQKKNKIGLPNDIKKSNKNVNMDSPAGKQIFERLVNMESSNREIKNALNRIAENQEMQTHLLREILKGADENRRVAEINYLLEVGEISAQEARMRMKNIKAVE